MTKKRKPTGFVRRPSDSVYSAIVLRRLEPKESVILVGSKEYSAAQAKELRRWLKAAVEYVERVND